MDLTGQKFGSLTVMYQSESKIRSGKPRITWHCKCECGNEIDAVAADLRSGKYKSCGCQQYSIAGHNFKDLTGKQFGKLLVINRIEDRVKSNGRHVVRWRCQCSCGGFKDVDAESLLSGHTRSCGCLRSAGEEVVSRILAGIGVRFLRNYQYKDLVSSKGNQLSFDFAILDNNHNITALIEFQGAQHYLTDDDVGSFGKLQRDETDQLKVDYCQKNHLKLYFIKYDDNIENKIAQIIKEVYDNTVPSL